MLNFVLQMASTMVDPTFFNVWGHAHRGTDPEHPKKLCDDALTQNLVSTKLYNYASFVISMLNLMLCKVNILRN
jgi:hypothetical protein